MKSYLSTMSQHLLENNSKIWLSGGHRELDDEENQTDVRGEFNRTEVSDLYGAGTRNRTAGLLITNQSLYQLSYPGIEDLDLISKPHTEESSPRSENHGNLTLDQIYPNQT